MLSDKAGENRYVNTHCRGQKWRDQLANESQERNGRTWKLQLLPENIDASAEPHDSVAGSCFLRNVKARWIGLEPSLDRELQADRDKGRGVRT
jgi:hypothetical protein